MASDPNSKIHLVLFFSRNVSLCTWQEYGMFEREVALYNWYTDHGVRVSFITYGGATDCILQTKIPGVEILFNRRRLPSPLYYLLIPILHAKVLRRATIFKTNQISGSRVAVLAAKFWRKPIIVRCGYLLSEFAKLGNSGSPRILRKAQRYEEMVFSSASSIVVASRSMSDYISYNYSVPTSRINVVPNHVLTDVFYPNITKPSRRRLCFVGRFTEQKNVPALVEACSGLDVELVLIGKGALQNQISAVAKSYDVNVTFLGVLSHLDLPYQLCKSDLYVHASLHEGSPPKSLLEAMSCGLPVICSNVPGIDGLIQHQETGWLCGTAPKEIREAIRTVLSDKQLREHMGRNARSVIVEHYSLNVTAPRETDVIKECLRFDSTATLNNQTIPNQAISKTVSK